MSEIKTTRGKRSFVGYVACFAAGIAVGVVVVRADWSELSRWEGSRMVTRRLQEAPAGMGKLRSRTSPLAKGRGSTRAAKSLGTRATVSELGELLGLSAQLEERVMRDLKLFGFGHLPPVRMRPQSRSLVQDMFVRLHNKMHQAGLLPLSAWGLGRGPYRKASMNDDVLSRIGMDLFFDEFAPLAPAGSACLEWGKPQYTTRVAACNASTTWNFRFARSGKAAINHKKRTLNADLNRLSASDMAGWPRFGTIICNQVFEHISSPFQAAVAIAEMLAPGGVLLFTAPFMEPFHRSPPSCACTQSMLGWGYALGGSLARGCANASALCARGRVEAHSSFGRMRCETERFACFCRMPGDFFRYTFDGARTLFETAGLQVVAQRKIGNTMLASAHLLGFGSGDFEAGLLRRELVRKVDNPLKPMNRVDEWAFIETALVAHKTK